MASGGLWHPALTDWVDEVERHWTTGGVPPPTCDRLRRELVVDLAQARAFGASVEELIATPTRQFALDVATAEGIDLRHPGNPHLLPTHRTSVGRFVLAGLVGLAIGALASVGLVYPLGFWFADTRLSAHPDPWPFVLLLHVLAATLAIACGSLGVRLATRSTEDARRLTFTTAVALAVSGAISLVLTMLFASTTDFSSAPDVIIVEVLIVVGICAGGLSATALRERCSSRTALT